MKLGIAMNFAHNSPEEWAQRHVSEGLSSVVFPCNYTAPTAEIDAYVKACKDFGLTIAEVGTWKNLMALDETERAQNFDYCKNQLALAEYIGACCCVNIAGAKGAVWDGGYKENYSEKTYAEIIDTVLRLLDFVKPEKTFYSLEPMPWMHPDSPQDYLQMIKDINHPRFGAHLDMVNMINSPQKYFFNEKYTDEAFELLSPYIKSCHIKDVKLGTELTMRLKEVPCGEGGFNLKHYIEQIDKHIPDVPVIIEHLDKAEEYLSAIRYIKAL